jgi:hypothetical protein
VAGAGHSNKGFMSGLCYQGTTLVVPNMQVRTGQVGNKRYRASG